MMFDYFGNAKTSMKQDAPPMDQAHAMAASSMQYPMSPNA